MYNELECFAVIESVPNSGFLIDVGAADIWYTIFLNDCKQDFP